MITRRSLLKSFAVGAAATAVPGALLAQNTPTADSIEALTVTGDIRQSVSRWCFGNIPLDDFCKICKKLGMVGVDLIGENDWDLVNRNDMIVTMGNGPDGIGYGFNQLKHHDDLVEKFTRLIPIAAQKNVPNLICFSGERRTGRPDFVTDKEGMENCVIGLKRLMPIAERHGVTIHMELLNSLRDHRDYQADKTSWAAEIVRNVGSERFKLLYDIYHMQIMEGNLIDNIRRYRNEIGHYHTAGVPGRNDLDDRQEIYYPAVMRAIKETGFKGFVAHEFIPRNRERGLDALRQAVEVCDV